MCPRLNVNPVNVHNIAVLLILGLYGDLTGEGEGASRLEDKRGVTDAHWFGVGVAHVDVEAYFFYGEVLGLSDEELPDVLLLGLGEDGLLGLQFPRIIAYFKVDNALEHGLHPMEIPLPAEDVTAGHILHKLIMQLLVLCLLGDLAPAERALLIDEEGLHDALVAEVVVAVGGDGPEEGLVADGAFVLVL
jgi:hypothetical protein